MNKLQYTIVRSNRRKTAAIIIRSDSTIEVRVPESMQESAITKLVDTKRCWINNKQAELKHCQTNLPVHNYCEGEQFLLCGNLYTLVISEGRGLIAVDGDKFRVTVPPGLIGDDRSKYIRAKLHRFYIDEALRFLRERSFLLGRQNGLLPVYIGVKEYKSRWGCCFSDGRIYFNWKLILAPEQIIDYVIVHELCHLKVRNHSKEYWRMVASILPDWQAGRNWLRRNGHGLEL